MNRLISITMTAILLVTAGCGGSGGQQQQGSGSGENNPHKAQSAHPPKVEKVRNQNQAGPDENRPAKRKIESLGFLEPMDKQKAVKDVNKVADHLTYVSFFSYRVKPDGGLTPLKKDEPALEETRKHGAIPMLVITNFEEGNFRPEVAHKIFTDKKASQRLTRNVIRVMKQKGYQALNVDFEHIKEKDKKLYNGFLETFLPAIKKEGFTVSTALAPKSSEKQGGAWHGAHDYAFHGKVADFVILMTYEWGWSGGPPMAVSPIPQVKKVLDHAVTKIPREKIVMGAPLYGYDWTLPYKKDGPPAKRLAPQEAMELAQKTGAKIQFNNRDQAPFFYYRDDQQKKHVVWFENEQSTQAKFDLIKEYRLRGIGYWVLGEEYPRNWSLLQDNFNIKKK
ncbi:MAG: glycosyl hydrolase family 18 protein [Firmicutes bacterium]|uniref:Spore germination protein n=1 Tax=Melghirimyces thermohalophilus TaxID=1236220 RepID=A0A1G6IXD7_9BACL|nr:glycosyl hydrolase family 18 protein [Melghirimyces thermohalophilus]MDA8353685.1 glycosyl hydrolase family 18 protein [Bacillota bacterium]SDC11124.1 spore germination protein [Melghirimyces thermohalophilus]